MEVRVDELVVCFGEKPFLGPVSFVVGEGEIFGIVGPNGSGKSTLLSALAGLVESSGHVGLQPGVRTSGEGLERRACSASDRYLGAGPGQPSGANAPPPHPSSLRSQTLSPSGEGISATPGAQVTDLHSTGLSEAGLSLDRTQKEKSRAKLLSFVAQAESYEFDVSLREVVMMGRHPHLIGNAESAEDNRIVDACLAALDLTELAERNVRTLSGGECQRMWIARALAQGTPVMLLDEPTAHLDPRHSVELRSLLRTLGKTLIITSHDLNWLLSFSDRVLLLKEGRCVGDETANNLKNGERLAEVFQTTFRRGVDSEGNSCLFI